jgi:hypothetical protein
MARLSIAVRVCKCVEPSNFFHSRHCRPVQLSCFIIAEVPPHYSPKIVHSDKSVFMLWLKCSSHAVNGLFVQLLRLLELALETSTCTQSVHYFELFEVI